MSLDWARPGLGAVGEYQSSGTPLVVTSTGIYNLKYFTRAITLISGAAIKIFDGENNASGTITCPSNTSIRLEVRFKKFQLVTAGSGVVLELTNIPNAAGEIATFANLT